MTNSHLRITLTVFLLLLAPLALAWSSLGHRLVGDIAEGLLTPATRAQVDELLAGEPDPTLGGVASWADNLRQTDPGRFKQTSSWHYINTPPDTCQYAPARDCPDGNCVIGAINAQRAILADRTQPKDKRRDALKFLVHFVGDAHQPLHANNHDDRGGNSYQISLRTDLTPESYAKKNYVDGVMGTNLHSIWDYYILGTAASPAIAEREYYERLAKHRAPAASLLKSTNPADWAAESCALVESQHLYPEGHKLDQAYLDKQRPLAESRVRIAGYRLAALLNTALAP